MVKLKNQVSFFKKWWVFPIMVMAFLPISIGYANQNPSFKYSLGANENFYGNSPGKRHDENEYDDNIKHGFQERVAEIWLYSIGSTIFISIVPFLILYFIPLDNSDKMIPRLKVLLAFGSGGLLGDAFLHLIPHAINNHGGHGHSHENLHVENRLHEQDHRRDTVVGLWILGGIITFLTVEKLVRLLKKEGFSNGHNHSVKKNQKDAKKNYKSNEHNEKKNRPTQETNKETVDISGYLNLVADFSHNFTDGLAIGASYMVGNNIGLVTTITILFHEIPHEIGDFAILIKSGCSRRKAMLMQLVTALGALAGNVLSIMGTESNADAIPWVLPFTAGGFVYIATVSVLPELLEESTKLGQSVKEIGALLIGVFLMIFISYFE